MRDVDDRREARGQPRQDVDQADAPRDREPGVARARRREADRVQRAADRRAVQQDREAGEHEKKERQLRRHDAAKIALAEGEERARKSGVVAGALGQALGEAAEQRERAERHDQRREPEAGDSSAFSAPPASPTSTRGGSGDGDRQMPVGRGDAEDDRREPHHRADRQIDAAGDDDRRQRHREQAELDAQARDLEDVAGGEEVRRDRREDHDLGGEREQQAAIRCPGRALATAWRSRARLRPALARAAASAATAARMIAPWIACSQ